MTADVRGELIKLTDEVNNLNTTIDEIKTELDVITGQLTKKQQAAILAIQRGENNV